MILESWKREEGPESQKFSKLSDAKIMESAREIVQGLQLWQDLKPRRVQALCACEGREENELSFEPGAVMTAVRPAAWMQARWLEGTLDGRVGLIYKDDVKYLD